MRETENITVHLQTIDDGVILRPIGDIDLARAPSLKLHLSEALKAKPMRLLVDLAEVPYMDSSGVATLIEAMGVARRTGSKLILCALQDKVRSIFEIARLDMVFKIVASTREGQTA